MKNENSEKAKKESLDRLNSDDFEILDIEHDLEFGRKDLNKGQTIDYSELSREQLEMDEQNLDEHYEKFFENIMESGIVSSTFT